MGVGKKKKESLPEPEETEGSPCQEEQQGRHCITNVVRDCIYSQAKAAALTQP